MEEVSPRLTPQEALAKARYYASLAKLGALSYDNGKRLAQPYIDTLNHAGKQIAIKYGRKYTPLTYSSLLR